MNRNIDGEYEDYKQMSLEILISENEELLQDIHAKNYNGTDDDMPDAFENWLQGFEYQELVDIIRSNI